MDTTSRLKVIDCGFTILRVEDYPNIRIKYMDEDHKDWHTLEVFPTKSSRDKALKELLEQPHFIQD